MHHMKSVTVRDLRYDFPKVERLLREGNPVHVTKRGKIVAMLAPGQEPATAPMPDFMGRLRALYGDKCLSIPGSEIVRQGRDR